MKRLSLLPLLVLLAGCSAEPASYQIATSEVSLTVERVKPYFWSDGWELSLVTRRSPDCQRRHRLKKSTGDNLKVEVYNPELGAYILRQGKRWYITELKTCAFDTFSEPPPEPGPLVGTFTEKDGVFKFVAAEGKAGEAPTAE
jgi:hypothetical protein